MLTLATALAACLLVATPAAASSSEVTAARFVPEATSATWDGDTVRVSFREVGLAPGAESTILIQATGVAEGACVRDGVTQFTLRSSATATDIGDYTADGNGTIDGSRNLHLTVGVPVVTGLDCTMVVTRSFTVALRDLRTGATLVLSGRAADSGVV